jgi:metal-sulfur cluster biosynthetic enzyme
VVLLCDIMISESDVKKILRTIIDPELGHNIVDLGLIYNIKVEDPKIKILMTLTTPGCPLVGYFNNTITSEVATAAGVSPDQVEIELTFDPPWSPEAMSEELRLDLGL